MNVRWNGTHLTQLLSNKLKLWALYAQAESIPAPCAVCLVGRIIGIGVFILGNWDSDMSLGDSFDDPESCECSVAFNRDECNSCGHELACIDTYCFGEEHRHRLSRSCDCLSGKEVEECEDCFHDLGCSMSDCDNENHDKVQTYGNPKFCSCRLNHKIAECSNCGHSIACLEDESNECDEPDHSHRLVYFNYPEHCECSDFQDSITCDSCKHDLNCPENEGYCSIHLRTEPQSPNGSQVLVEDTGTQTIEDSSNEVWGKSTRKAGAYWTREEDEILASHYLGGASDAEISHLLFRSVRAIQTRLLKICFDANGVNIEQNLTYPSEARSPWAETDDILLEGLASTQVKLSNMSQALQRSELAVAYRLVARRIAKPGNLDLIFYHEKKHPDLVQGVAIWTVDEYLVLKEQFHAGDSIRDLALKSGKSEFECFRILYTMGEISNTELDIALRSAAGTSGSRRAI
jgi:hypothetical protein